MKYLDFRRKWLPGWVAGWVTVSAWVPPGGLAAPPPEPAPVPQELEELVPSLAARRLSARDFAEWGEKWARFHECRKLEARVREVNREGEWVRVDFDQKREGGPASDEVFRLAWNEAEEGPAPFAQHQRVWIWVSPEGNVDGFELGVAVHRWRHREDGKVELVVRDEMVDGSAVLVRMVPDRYAGSEVGKTMYWKGEGLCTGATGTVPLGQKIHVEDLAAADTSLEPEAAAAKNSWVRPGLTPLEEEIRGLLREYADRPETEGVTGSVAWFGAGGVFKLRLQREVSGPGSAESKALRPVSKTGAGWGRSSSPAPAKRSAGGGSVEDVLGSLFGKKPASSGEKAAVSKPAEDGGAVAKVDSGGSPAAAGTGGAQASVPAATAAAAEGRPVSPPSAAGAGTSPAPGPAPGTVRGAGPAAVTGAALAPAPAPAQAAPGGGAGEPAMPEALPATLEATGPVRHDASWFGLLKERAMQRRREAYETLSSSRSPGSAVSRTWTDVAYENAVGEPLRASVATLPRVPLEQFVPETRAMP